METENFIRVYDNVFTPEHCEELIEIFKNTINELSHQGKVRVENDSGRADVGIFLQDIIAGNKHCENFYQALEEPLRKYCDTFPIILETNFSSYAVKVQQTKPGQGYHTWHFEKGGFEVNSRLLVWTVYLNDIEEGGETEFLYQSKRYKPKQGSVMLFPASFTHTHRGNPPLEQTKYIATGWYNLTP